MDTSRSSRIVALAQLISNNTQSYEKHLESKGIPTPSFGVETPLDLDLPKEVSTCRQDIIEAMDELQSLILGPVQTVNTMRENCSPILQAFHRFNFATSFPVGETATFEEIAQKCGRDVGEVRRLLRMAMTYRLFQEPKPGVVAHTAATKALAEKPLLNSWCGMWIEEISLPWMVDALTKWPASEEPHQAAFNLKFNTDNELYEEIGKHPSRALRFKDAMAYFQTAPGFESSHAVNGFDWGSLIPSDGTVVDVGGSHGMVCIELARKFPNLQFIVQDREEIVKAGESQVPQDVAERVKFMTYNFFDEQPVKGADVYFYRWIFHNWSDKYCRQIFQGLIPALKSGARILIQELLIPEPGELSPYRERKTRWTDMGMMGMANSKERSRSDWLDLFQTVDSRLILKDIKTPLGSELSVVEVLWR